MDNCSDGGEFENADDIWDDTEENWEDVECNFPDKKTSIEQKLSISKHSEDDVDLKTSKKSALQEKTITSFDEQKLTTSKALEMDKKDSENTVKNIPQVSIKSTEETQSSWSGWKPWTGVVSSVFTAATESVTSLTTHVSQVIENSIGVPNPEDLAKTNKNIESSSNDGNSQCNNNDSMTPSFGNLVTNVTSIGNKVITGGLDTLESIGKKTMNILQENDPLLLNKRKMMGLDNEKPVLSQVLREAKEKSEEVEKNLKQMQKQSYKKQLHFESLFDHYYGLVHLEALEILSKQSVIKLQSLLEPLSGKALNDLKETLNEVEELCDLREIDYDDMEEPFSLEQLEKKLSDAIEDLGIEVNFSEMLKSWEKNLNDLNENVIESQTVYECGLRCLAETCALQINMLHKIAELLIVKNHHSTANEADSLVQLTTIFCQHLHGIANKYGQKLNEFQQTEEIKSSITNIFLEVCNSTEYVQSAFRLLVPILQVGAA